MGLNEKFFTSEVDVPDYAFFRTLKYNGSGYSKNISANTIGFQPDLVWIKDRTNAYSHQMFDTIRGATKRVLPDLQLGNNTNANSLSSFVDGFTVISNVGVNKANDEYVAWCWKAGGSASTNTDGDLNSQVSADTRTGFSVVTGSAGHGGYSNTFGHGLGQKPDMIITKQTNTDSDWFVIFPKLSNALLKLNTANVFSYDSTFQGTSTGFKMGFTGSAFSFVAYCFASVSGVSKIGTYTGTGNSLPINTGFRPSFVMIKSSAGAGGPWQIFDNQRTGPEALFPNTNATGTSYSGVFEFTSNGFRNIAAHDGINRLGSTYIYYAIAT